MTDWREMRDLTAVNAGDFKAQGNLELDSAMGGRSRGGAGTFSEAQSLGASHGQASQGGEINRMYNKASTLKLKHGVVRPRTANQSTYIASIGTHDVNFGIGPAGTGKTYLAVAAAVDALERNEVRRIILTRPAVEAGEKLGFLPGDLSQKVDPYLRPLYDALFEMLGFEKVEKLIERQIIEIAPLAYMRGRTLNDSFIILDEAQNTTIEQMKMFLTRIGFNSKAVITGDPSQIDLPRNVKSGLKHALEVLQGIDSISFTFFETVDVVRHPVVAAIVNAYAAWDKKQEELKAQRLREGIESRMSGEGLPHAFREGRGGYSRGYEQRFSQRAGGSAEFIQAEAVTDRAAEAGQAQPAEPAAKAAQDAAAAAAAVKPEE
ncbi:MAG: PhoH family protein [Proteobacteria bacterium]|uniref:PhoH-like protein n=1 Tax=Candidatus Avisuccinivibrio stercorigallinarum TaxID=2840704 RepID=A0A9D9D988_9GAMM|nr:PhoH family protein [Candidatus Avisuccinivibrio stercorigallinarum]